MPKPSVHTPLPYEFVAFLALTRLPLPPSLYDSTTCFGARLALMAWMNRWVFILCISSLLRAGQCLGLSFLFFNLAHVPFYPASVGWLVFLPYQCTTPAMISLIFLPCCYLWAYGLKHLPCQFLTLFLLLVFTAHDSCWVNPFRTLGFLSPFRSLGIFGPFHPFLPLSFP